MDFNYVGYTGAGKVVKDVTSAPSEQAAVEALSRSGYRILSLKPAISFMPRWREMFPALFRIKPEAVLAW